MDKHLLNLFFLFTFALLRGQNLIRNASFENCNNTPRREGNSINRAVGWIAPKYNSDYYQKGGGFFHAGTPHNIFGHQRPHSGKAYAGICTRTHFLEYIETVMRDSMVAGQTYLIELYVSRAELSIRTIKEFGVLFTRKKIWGVETRGIAFEPQVKFTKKHGFRNKHRWTKLSATYTAEGGERVFTFGHFNYQKNDDKRRLNAHYYIDDVSVTAIYESPAPSADTLKTDTIEPQVQQVLSTISEPILGKKMVLEHVFFETNKAEVLPTSYQELNTLLTYLTEHSNVKLSISGHTDNSGDEKRNQVLSEKRAAAVATFLIEKGVDADRIEFKGFGSSLPIDINTTEEGRRKNRRVEILLFE